MQVAIMSDIHGFDLAFRAVLEDIDRSGPFDLVAVAGDLCVVGPRPDEVVRIVRERGLAAVKGNTDAELIEGTRTDSDIEKFRYAGALLSADDIAFLDALPFELRVSPPRWTRSERRSVHRACQSAEYDGCARSEPLRRSSSCAS